MGRVELSHDFHGPGRLATAAHGEAGGMTTSHARRSEPRDAQLPDAESSGESADQLAERVTEYGWVAKGLVFMVIGLVALELARRGTTSSDADQVGALQQLTEAPAGRVLVLAVGAGLLLFACWQMWSAFRRDSDDLLGLLKRIGWAGLSVVYATIGLTGLEIGIEGPAADVVSGEGGATSPDGLAQRLLGLPGGRVTVIAVGIGTLAVAVYHLRKGLRQDFLGDIDTEGLTRLQCRGLTVLGVAGFGARAVLLGIAGYLFVVAAWRYDADEAAGIDEALRTLAGAPFGRALLGVCAVGIFAAGTYDLVTFRRQRLVEDD